MKSSQTDNRLKTSEDYYREGNTLRQQGNFPAAMNSYMEAIALDPDSPAVEAMKMLEEIMNYYCKDMYNP
jgi:Tetratricopeptide repeat.